MRKLLMTAILTSPFLIGGPTSAAEILPDFSTVPAGWTVDRYAPDSFSNVGPFQGRTNVLGIGIGPHGAAASRPAGQQGTFYNTQGMSIPLTGNGHGSSLSVDLFVPTSWLNPANGARRTDAWLVVNDPGPGDPHDYPIIGFTNNNLQDGYVGFRVWDSLNGVWINLPTATVMPDAWNALTITDQAGGLTGTQFVYQVNGVTVATVAGDAADTTLDKLIMQAYNFEDTVNGLSNPVSGLVANNYVADWSVPEPGTLVVFGIALTVMGATRRKNKDAVQTV